MRLSLLAIAAGLAHLVSSQVENLPECARTCVTQFTTGGNIGGCQSLDAACICSSAGFLSGIACCLAGKCNDADQAAAVTFAQTFCKASGVTNLPSAVTCASTSTTPSATAKSGAQRLAGIGAGLYGGLAAGVVLL
ncbi:uncharacterized protein BP5553_05961 [Venustampulla echinocandica]|uniref:CFEM domain-containing protein n=1 Tax=Venustampulla echinocandica TaxID=2656787 RepID=A0A370TM69_9HELO|nr:uncharacterized protein BP5553_05961 [Venustampulla echinocandica]RDL36609.1 hypothetical protein BP5553_05961 [Venustampulla echinocandica]